MEFHLPDLPYPSDAFAGFLSSESFQYHYKKHHQKYVDQTNALLKDDVNLSRLTLEEIVKRAEGSLLNNAAQAWNHTFFWHSIHPEPSHPSEKLATAITASFPKGMDGLRTEFLKKGKELFGSGWIWLAADPSGGLEVIAASNAGTPLRNNKRPLFTADVWEHAYYIDHRNARDGYLEQFFDRISWKFASENFERPDVANMTDKMRPHP